MASKNGQMESNLALNLFKQSTEFCCALFSAGMQSGGRTVMMGGSPVVLVSNLNEDVSSSTYNSVNPVSLIKGTG